MKVVFLHEPGGGVISEINSNERVTVIDEDGFTRIYFTSKIAPVYQEEYHVDEHIIENIQNQDNSNNQKKSKKSLSIKQKNKIIPEIDLHIEELVKSHKGLSNHEILTKQMSAFRQFYFKAKSNKTQKIIVIHGVGEGVLRFEIRSFLSKENGVEFYDANYQKYGQGATVVELFSE